MNFLRSAKNTVMPFAGFSNAKGNKEMAVLKRSQRPLRNLPKISMPPSLMVIWAVG